jgi:hypothetical protein
MALADLGEADGGDAGTLRSGSRRRAVLAVDGTTCDLYVLGLDGRLRVFSGGDDSLRCRGVLQPRPLAAQLIASVPGVWREKPDAPGRGASGAPAAVSPDLRQALYLVAPAVPGATRLLAVVGQSSVGVLSLPGSDGDESSALSGAVDRLSLSSTSGASEVAAVLSRLGLDSIVAPLANLGYDSLAALHALSPAEREEMASQAGLKPGHARTLSLYLDGRVLPSSPTVSADARGHEATAPGSSGGGPTVRAEPAWLAEIPSAALQPASPPSPTFGHVPSSPFVPVGNGEPRSVAGPPFGILQVEWHPLSSTHLAILTSHSTLLLFDASTNLFTPELSLSLPPDADQPAVAFTFAPPSAAGWASLAVYLACADGAYFGACPVLPASRAARHHLSVLAPTLLKTAPSDAARRWVQASAVGRPFRSPEMAPSPGASLERLTGRLSGVGSVSDARVAVQGPFLMFDAEGDAVPLARKETDRAREDGGEGLNDSTLDVRALAACALPLRCGATLLCLGLSSRDVLVSLATSPIGPSWEGDEYLDEEWNRDEASGAEAAVPPLSLLFLSRACAAAPPESPAGWLRFIPDPIRTCRVYTHCASGIQMVPLSWADEWGDFLFGAADAPPATPPRELPLVGLLPRRGANGTWFPARGRGPGEMVGGAVLYDPSVGEALFGLGGDGRAYRLRLEGVGAAEGAVADAAGGGGDLLSLLPAALAHVGDSVHSELPRPLHAKLTAAAEPGEAALAAAAEAHEALGAGALREAVTLAAQAELRAAHVAKRAGRQASGGGGGSGIAAETSLFAVADEIEAAAHKARFATAMQDQLEMRAKLLRAMLRTPAMCASPNQRGELNTKHSVNTHPPRSPLLTLPWLLPAFHRWPHTSLRQVCPALPLSFHLWPYTALSDTCLTPRFCMSQVAAHPSLRDGASLPRVPRSAERARRRHAGRSGRATRCGGAGVWATGADGGAGGARGAGWGRGAG